MQCEVEVMSEYRDVVSGEVLVMCGEVGLVR